MVNACAWLCPSSESRAQIEDLQRCARYVWPMMTRSGSRLLADNRSIRSPLEVARSMSSSNGTSWPRRMDSERPSTSIGGLSPVSEWR